MIERLAGNDFEAAADPIVGIPRREFGFHFDNLLSPFQARCGQAGKTHTKIY
jgi:hypothetical protein